MFLNLEVSTSYLLNLSIFYYYITLTNDLGQMEDRSGNFVGNLIYLKL